MPVVDKDWLSKINNIRVDALERIPRLEEELKTMRKQLQETTEEIEQYMEKQYPEGGTVTLPKMGGGYLVFTRRVLDDRDDKYTLDIEVSD